MNQETMGTEAYGFFLRLREMLPDEGAALITELHRMHASLTPEQWRALPMPPRAAWPTTEAEARTALRAVAFGMMVARLARRAEE